MLSNKICFQCLTPMKECRKPDDPKTCQKQLAWGLKCKHCNSTSHHSLNCPTKSTPSYQSDHKGGPRGGGRGGRGGGRGGRGGRGRGRGGYQNNDKKQSNTQHENNSYSSGPNPNSNNGADQTTNKLYNNPNQHKSDLGQVQGQPDLSNANFLTEQDPEL